MSPCYDPRSGNSEQNSWIAEYLCEVMRLIERGEPIQMSELSGGLLYWWHAHKKRDEARK